MPTGMVGVVEGVLATSVGIAEGGLVSLIGITTGLSMI